MNPFVWHSRKGKTIVTNGRSLVASARWWQEEIDIKRAEITFWGDGDFLCAVQYGTPQPHMAIAHLTYGT